MVPWEALIVYALINVAAALFAWLPFRLLDRISLVDQIDTTNLENERPVAIPASGYGESRRKPRPAGQGGCPEGPEQKSSDEPGQRLL